MAETIQIQPTAVVDAATAEGTASQTGNTQRVVVSSEPKPVESKPVENTVPEKFRKADGQLDTEKLLASYGELEKKFGTGDKKVETPAPTTTPETPKGLTADDIGKLSEEFRASGKLSDDTYKGLEAKGITRDIADNYIAGQTARAEQYSTALNEHVGGKAALESIIEWAGANLTDAEITTANKSLSSGDQTQAKLALDGLKARFTAANGSAPNLVTGAESARATSVQPFRSNEEVTKAMSDPRYRNDEAYRQDVYKRLAATK